ncbi:type III effector protein, partial [Streptomyces atratus]
ERRYLRGRPGPAGTTGEQRVTATRQARAADRTTASWARRNAADLRRLAGQITALTDLPATARRPLSELHAALAHDDPADLIAPLTATRRHLTTTHPDLASQLDTLTPP